MIKEELNTLRDNKHALDYIARQIQGLRETAEGVGGMGFSGTTLGGERLPKQQLFLERLERLEQKYHNRLAAYTALYERLVTACADLSTAEKHLVFARYADGKSWYDVNRELGISRQQSQRMMRKILRKIAQTP